MEDFTILEGVSGHGQNVGTFMCWGSNSPGWWGEGEIEFFINPATGEYMEFSTPYAGMPQVIAPNEERGTPPRFGLYRWHIMDPIRVEQDMRVTIQALGWQSEGRYRESLAIMK